MQVFIGIDNGVTGTIGVITPDSTEFIKTPVFKEQNYTKTKGNISRVNIKDLYSFLEKYKEDTVHVMIERPLVNPKRFKASISALRALEATLIVVEQLGYAYEYIDSKEWQKVLLPKGIKGSPELKKASKEIGCRKYPQHKDLITKHEDADGMLMAEFCMLKYKL